MDIVPNPTLAEVRVLLERCGLPGEDLEERHMAHFIVARGESGPVGVAGLQVLGTVGLLRSVAVDRPARSQGLGKRLVSVVEARARELGLSHLFLLTNDAEPYFARLGYTPQPRSGATLEIQGTSQFGSCCCKSATFMGKKLQV
jgi:amino-acid N-acetyltransferase